MKNIGIIGVGNIGSSITRLLLKNGNYSSLLLSDIKKYPWVISNENNIKSSDIIVIAVKPTDVEYVINDIKQHSDNEDKMIISAAAGISINYIEKKLESTNYPIVRIMPNLPVGYGTGVITYFSNNNVHQNNIQNIKNIFDGPYMHQVVKEELIDVSVVLTSCMPGFIAEISKHYIDFGTKHGFTKEESKKLYTETLQSTAQILMHKDPDMIINKVATPNGVTQKGLNVLNDLKLKDILDRSMNISYNKVKAIKDSFD